MHNFNFTKVQFVSETQSHVNTSLYLYHIENEQIIFNSEIFLSQKILNKLPKKINELTPIITENNHSYYFLCVQPEKNIEKTITQSVKTILLHKQNAILQIFAKGYNFNTKLLVSKVIFETKNEWNLKKQENVELFCKSVFVIVDNAKELSFKAGEALAETQSFVQQLVNMPANYLTPTKFGELVQSYISKEKLTNSIEVNVYDKDYILQQGMNSFYGVAKGSSEEPKLIVMRYNNGAKEDKPIVLVGKGLTFDSGGISIKPSNGMDAMKTDMAGAATVIGSIIYAAKNKLPINMVVVAACCENMPDGSAVKPGDVLTAMNGTTIEVLDTDAEGRLVLADALYYSQQFDGKYTIDMATLTGACIVALGHVHTGIFTKDCELSTQLIVAGNTIKDLAWQLPLTDEHEEMLDSKVADISNLCLGKGAGAQNGAVFLQKFAPKQGWCHMDIAGTSNLKGSGSTSRPLALMSEFLDNISK